MGKCASFRGSVLPEYGSTPWGRGQELFSYLISPLGYPGALPTAGVGFITRIVATWPFAPPRPPVNAAPVCAPFGLNTGVGPVAPLGTGNTVPPGVTRKFGIMGTTNFSTRPVASLSHLSLTSPSTLRWVCCHQMRCTATATPVCWSHLSLREACSNDRCERRRTCRPGTSPLAWPHPPSAPTHTLCDLHRSHCRCRIHPAAPNPVAPHRPPRARMNCYTYPC